jgi:hypothetical protein
MRRKNLPQRVNDFQAPVQRYQANGGWPTYMFKANMARAAWVLLGTGSSGELARPAAM